MPRGKELSPQLRSRVCELHSLGYGYKRIHKIHPEIPVSTIQTTIRREAVRRDNQSRPRSGAPKKLSEEQRDRIYDIVTHEKPHISTEDLLKEVNHAIKERALRYLLREMGRRRWLRKKRLMLTPQHAAARLTWAHRYREFDWRRVKWSDEAMVYRGGGVRPTWTFLSPREQIAQGDVSHDPPQGSVRQIYWALFGHETRSGLITLDRRVNSILIYDLHASFLPDLVSPGDIFI